MLDVNAGCVGESAGFCLCYGAYGTKDKFPRYVRQIAAVSHTIRCCVVFDLFLDPVAVRGGAP